MPDEGSKFVMVDREEYETLKGYIENINIIGGDIQYFGDGVHAGINIIVDPGTEGLTGVYNGPFQVKKKNDTEVTIRGYNLSEGRLFRNWAILGLTTVEFNEGDLTISGEGYACAKITYSSPNYVTAYEFVTTANFATIQSATAYYVPLAFITWESSAIKKIYQLQYGIIEGAGRLF